MNAIRLTEILQEKAANIKSADVRATFQSAIPRIVECFTELELYEGPIDKSWMNYAVGISETVFAQTVPVGLAKKLLEWSASVKFHNSQPELVKYPFNPALMTKAKNGPLNVDEVLEQQPEVVFTYLKH